MRFGPYLFYDSTIKLWFDSDTHTYFREWGAGQVAQPGVTTILRIIDKSEFLVPWSAKKVSEKLKVIFPLEEDGLDVFTQRLPLEEFHALCDSAKKAPREILEDAGDVGTEAHDALEQAIKFAIATNGGVVEKLVTAVKDERAQKCCSAALDWMAAHKVRWIATEQKIYSREHEFAGTMDGKAFVTSCDNPVCCPVRFADARSIIDWKSSNQLSVSYLPQVAAYRAAKLEETGEELTDGFILRLGKEKGEFEPWHMTAAEMDKDFEIFLLCKALTEKYEATKQRVSAASKARTQRKRAAKKKEKELA